MNVEMVKKYTKDLNILYIGEEFTIIKFLQKLFRRVIHCKDSFEGFDTYKQDRKFFDIILSDISVFFYQNDIDILKKIRRLNPKQKIIIFSNQNNLHFLRELINIAIDGFFLKPINQKQVLQILYKISKNIYNEKSLILYKKNIEQINKLLYKKLKFNEESNYLTGLKNRSKLLKDIDKFHFTMLALVDIDHLKFINNLYGSNIGNLVIQKFTKFLEKEVNNNGYFIYQISADEFAICSNDKSIDKFKKFIKKLSHKVTNLELYIEEIDDEISIDATIGVTYELNYLVSCGMVYESHLLLAQADTALKYAKNHKIPIISYDESINTLQNIQNIMEWKQKIKKAYNNNDIVPVFQPIVDKNGKILKYETLMRLREIDEDGNEKLISAFFFLDVAILTKQYAKISKRIISQALKKLIQTNHTLSINLTYSDTQDIKIISLLEKNLKQYDIGKRLILEIVESEDIKDYQLLENFLKIIRPYGVKIAIDDFGSGFSNFENIIKLKADYIKIDGTLIKNIDKDKTSLAIVKAIVQFAHTLNIKIIAEFVHSKEVFEILKNLGIDEYQGFYFYEPSLSFIK